MRERHVMYNRGVVVLLGPNFVALFSVKTREEKQSLGYNVFLC